MLLLLRPLLAAGGARLLAALLNAGRNSIEHVLNEIALQLVAAGIGVGVGVGASTSA